MEAWCPFATRVEIAGHTAGAGRMADGYAPKILHHTTEGDSIAGAEATYRKTGNLPHFTDTFETGKYIVHQHLPLDVGATALKHTGTPETNRAHVIQFEHVGYAATSHDWEYGYLDGIARTCRWVEEQTGCPAAASVRFVTPDQAARNAVRLDGKAWTGYAGHLGHQHVPENDHVDPGAIDIVRILKGSFATMPLPRFNPPFNLAAIVDAAKDPYTVDGFWLLGLDGAIYAFEGAADNGGPNGKPYWGNRRAAHFDREPSGALITRSGPKGQGPVVCAQSEHPDGTPETYGPPF